MTDQERITGFTRDLEALVNRYGVKLSVTFQSEIMETRTGVTIQQTVAVPSVKLIDGWKEPQKSDA